MKGRPRDIEGNEVLVPTGTDYRVIVFKFLKHSCELLQCAYSVFRGQNHPGIKYFYQTKKNPSFCQDKFIENNSNNI